MLTTISAYYFTQSLFNMTLDPVLRAAMAQNKAYICTLYIVRRALIASKEALYDLSKRRLIKKN